MPTIALAAVLALAGCSELQRSPIVSFLDYVRAHDATFSLSAPQAVDMSVGDAIATVRGDREPHAAFRATTPLGESYGILTCGDAASCRDAFSSEAGPVVHLWVVWSLAADGPDAGRWVAVNAVTGLYAVSGPD